MGLEHGIDSQPGQRLGKTILAEMVFGTQRVSFAAVRRDLQEGNGGKSLLIL